MKTQAIKYTCDLCGDEQVVPEPGMAIAPHGWVQFEIKPKKSGVSREKHICKECIIKVSKAD